MICYYQKHTHFDFSLASQKSDEGKLSDIFCVLRSKKAADLVSEEKKGSGHFLRCTSLNMQISKYWQQSLEYSTYPLWHKREKIDFSFESSFR